MIFAIFGACALKIFVFGACVLEIFGACVLEIFGACVLEIFGGCVFVYCRGRVRILPSGVCVFMFLFLCSATCCHE